MSGTGASEVDTIYMTQKAYAQFIGVTQGLVSRMKNDGRLVSVAGRGIDALESKKLYDAKQGALKIHLPKQNQNLRGGAEVFTGLSGKGESREQILIRGTVAQADLTEHKAKNEQLKHEQASGALLPRDEVESEFYEFARGLRDSLQNIPAKIAPLICSALGVKVDKSFDVEQIMSDAIRSTLEDLARSPTILKPKKGNDGRPDKS